MSLTKFLVRYSLTRFNKSRPLRLICREGYWLLGALYCHLSPLHLRNVSMMKNGEIVDTYPRFYQDISRLGFEEKDDDKDYSLIPDPSKSIVGYATSYCAYKIYETTGTWPKRTSRRRFDAKDWREFLREAGYWEVDPKPSPSFFYVGVRDNDYRPYGEVVWFERYEEAPERVLVTTYDQKMFVPKIVRTKDYTWVKIARRPR